MSREKLFNLRRYFTGLSSWRGILSEAVYSSVFLCVCGVSGQCRGGAGLCDCNYGGVVGGWVYGWSGISRVSKILLQDLVCSLLRCLFFVNSA